MPPEKRERLAWALKQRDGIMSLEGLEPTSFRKKIDEALLAGRVDVLTADKELVEWIQEHKSLDGFLETRRWIEQ